MPLTTLQPFHGRWRRWHHPVLFNFLPPHNNTSPTENPTMPTLNINGKDTAVDADESTPILWALRDTLGMTGTKFGCGQALCGACTVHLNGAPIRSCITP